MADSDAITTSQARDLSMRGGANPLAVIVVFISLTEFVAGSALILKAEGNVLVGLTVFIITFPLLVAIAFFIVLWYRPTHLYAPRDHSSSEDFLKSLRVNHELKQAEATAQNQAYEKQIATLQSELEKRLVENAGATKSTISAAVTEAVDAAKKATSITVRFPDGRKKVYALAAVPNFGTLTDQVFLNGDFRVDPYTYGTQWVLEDPVSGRQFQHARTITGIGPGGPLKDNRALGELGIAPGAELQVILLNNMGTRRTS